MYLYYYIIHTYRQKSGSLFDLRLRVCYYVIMLIDIVNAGFTYGDASIVDNVNLRINDGDRIGLIGQNGAGKTTLLKLIIGELELSKGEIGRKDGLICGYLRQNEGLESRLTVYDEMLTVFSKVLEAVKKQEELSRLIAETPHDSFDFKRLSSQYDNNASYIAAKEGYNVDVKIKTVLNGMGFAERYRQIVATMSGGEKTRLAIAKLLLKAPELLILDEPTNHLDFKTLAWLEGYLESYKGALVIVSHDRYFLDRMVNGIWELDDGSVEAYNGNYSTYKVTKSELMAFRIKEYEKQQIEIAAMKDYIARNICRATTANSAKSRVHRLANMERLTKPRTTKKTPVFRFDFDYESNKNVLTVSDLKLEIDRNLLLEDVGFEVKKGERIAILGANGTGKSTLMRALANNGDPRIKYGKDVKTAYYDQENQNLDFGNTVLEELWGRHHRESQTAIRSILGGLLLGAEDIEKRVGVLSGGERAKLGLAVIMADRCNTLLLDEPTNHLDLITREALEDALAKFEGTIIFVSHDRYFINRVATAVFEIENRRLIRYGGNFDAYENIKKRQAAVTEFETNKPAQKSSSYRTAKERAEDVRTKQRVAELEKLIDALEKEIEAISEQMLMPDILSDYQKYREMELLQNAKKAELEEYYNEWVTVVGDR